MPVNGAADSSVMMLQSRALGTCPQSREERPEFPDRFEQVPGPLVQAELEQPPRILKSTGFTIRAVIPRAVVSEGEWRRESSPGHPGWSSRISRSRSFPACRRGQTGPFEGFRLDPNTFNAVQNVVLYWVRLTPSPNSPLAAKQTITWTGSGPATITVRDNSDGSVFPVVSGLSGNSYLWNYGVLAPGSYTLTVTNSSGTGSATFSINNPPSIELTNPSATSGADYATTVLGNPWDMSSAADIQLTGSDYFTNLSFSGGMLHATNTINDPNVTLLYNTNNSVPIDTSRFRYLTYWLQVDGPYDLGAGSVARVVWNSQLLMSGTTATVSQDIIVWPGMNSYTIDLATLSAATRRRIGARWRCRALDRRSQAPPPPGPT